ncbi:LysR family transcriptional regulator [Saccharopolyspora sp. NPDC000995]
MGLGRGRYASPFDWRGLAQRISAGGCALARSGCRPRRSDCSAAAGLSAVAQDLQHFGRAARRLQTTQPPVTRHVRALEKVIGIRLLKRSSHRVELTPAGEVLRAELAVVLGRLDRALARVFPPGSNWRNCPTSRSWPSNRPSAQACRCDAQRLRHRRFRPDHHPPSTKHTDVADLGGRGQGSCLGVRGERRVRWDVAPDHSGEPSTNSACPASQETRPGDLADSRSAAPGWISPS